MSELKQIFSGKLVNPQQDQTIKSLESQLEEAREYVKTYKYDLDTLSSIVIECVYDMSNDEAMSILKEVADHYKKLKEQSDE